MHTYDPMMVASLEVLIKAGQTVSDTAALTASQSLGAEKPVVPEPSIPKPKSVSTPQTVVTPKPSPSSMKTSAPTSGKQEREMRPPKIANCCQALASYGRHFGVTTLTEKRASVEQDFLEKVARRVLEKLAQEPNPEYPELDQAQMLIVNPKSGVATGVNTLRDVMRADIARRRAPLGALIGGGTGALAGAALPLLSQSVRNYLGPEKGRAAAMAALFGLVGGGGLGALGGALSGRFAKDETLMDRARKLGL